MTEHSIGSIMTNTPCRGTHVAGCASRSPPPAEQHGRSKTDSAQTQQEDGERGQAARMVGGGLAWGAAS